MTRQKEREDQAEKNERRPGRKKQEVTGKRNQMTA